MLGGSLVHASAPRVAVMPFRDLSGQKASVGEAIRETVTTDLKEVKGVTVVERGEIDKVLGEQKLQATRTDLDPGTSVKVGKLLGASLIVTGAYQREDKQVRLTARFVKVETGEIVGTAKVDGPSADFLRLQDRVTAELLRSAGMDAGAVRKVAQRTRPKLKGLRAIELYGDAVVEPDDEKRGEILRQALVEDPAFSYALKDLEALEKRMKAYAKVASAAREKEHARMRAELAAEPDPLKRAQLQVQLMGALVTARRYRALIVEARAILAGPPPPAAPGNVKVDEIAAFYLLTADQGLRQHDALLRDGEAFLKRFSTSVYFKPAEQMIQSVIDERRRVATEREKLPQALERLSVQQRWDPCAYARIYARAGQHLEAQRLYRACVAAATSDRVQAIVGLVEADVEGGDFAAARRDVALFDGTPQAGNMRHLMEQRIPDDG